MDPEQWQKLDQIFHACLEREAGSREAFLQEACAKGGTIVLPENVTVVPQRLVTDFLPINNTLAALDEIDPREWKIARVPELSLDSQGAWPARIGQEMREGIPTSPSCMAAFPSNSRHPGLDKNYSLCENGLKCRERVSSHRGVRHAA